MTQTQTMTTQSTRQTRVLIVSTEPLYESLAGPGIRTVQMARYLAPHCHVTLAAPRQAHVVIPGVARTVMFQHEDRDFLKRLAQEAEVIILQGFTLYHHAYLATMGKILVIDMYDPYHLECLEFFKQEDLAHARLIHGHKVHVVDQQLRAGDFFICASERQRDFWLGALGSLGRLSPESYARDPTFRTLIDVVPFGIEPHPPVHEQQVLKGIWPGIEPDDTVVLWGGGIWDWLDPLTVIRAMYLVRQQRPDVKLFFLGFHHPNPVDVPKMRVYEACLDLVQELDLADTVLFNSQWVPYDKRANYFLEADIGVSAHLDHIETRYAFRTRLLDYMWTGLPMVVSAGDTLADLVVDKRLGHVVAPGDVAGYADALLTLAQQPAVRQHYAPAFAAVQPAYVWPIVLKPLVRFCIHPRPAADSQRLVVQDAYQRRIEELDKIVATKNDHIAYLEDMLRRLESGRAMHLMRVLDQQRTRLAGLVRRVTV